MKKYEKPMKDKIFRLAILALVLVLGACGKNMKAAITAVNPGTSPTAGVAGVKNPGNTPNGGTASGTSVQTPTGSGGVVGGTPAGNSVPLSAEETIFFTLINQLRASYGVPPLQLSPLLQGTAQAHSAYMDLNDVLDHAEPAPNGSSGERIANAGGNYMTTGENIACGNDTAEGTYQQWVNSPGHLANMIATEYQYIGISRAGTAATESNHSCPYYWTTDFAGN